VKTKSFMETDAFGFVVKMEIDRMSGKRIDRMVGAKLAFLLALCIGLANAGVFFENGTVSYAGDYAIITFLQSGSITVVNQTLYNVSFLAISGGGGGGDGGCVISGGGGGGAAVETGNYTLTPGTFPAVVGAGGAGAGARGSGCGCTCGGYDGRGANGGTSSFGSFSVSGGGGSNGGIGYPGGYAYNANDGGSGGGSGTGSAGAGSAYGGNGAIFYSSGSISTAGGGGGARGNATPSAQPNGAVGYCSSISGSSVCYGGGGGGGANGLGATGGAGGSNVGGLGGVNNFAIGGSGLRKGSDGVLGGGGGGGSGYDTGGGGNGGNGIVIVKMNISYYPQPANATGYLTYCGNETNTTAITWAVYDLITGNPIQHNIIANMQQVFNFSLLTKNFTSAVNNSSNFSLCIFPENATAYAQTTDTITSVGYNPYQNAGLPTYYTNNTTIYSVYLLTTNESKLVQIYVVNNILAPMLNVSVQIQQVNPLTSQILNLGSFPVDSFGTATQPLQPATQVYHFTVLSNNGTVLQDFANQAIPCNSFDLVCQLILIVNPMGGIGYTNGTFNGICGWNNATGVLNCTPSNITPITTNLLVSMINATASNSTACNTSGVGANTVTCTLSNSTGNCYNYVFSANLTTGETPTLDGGMVCVSTQTLTNYGGIGLIITFLLVAFLAIAGLAFGASGACFGAAFGIAIAVAFSFVTGLAWFGGIMAIAGLVIVGWTIR